MDNKIYYAGIIIIGNEILSGKTQDLNIKFLAYELNELGIRTAEVSVIPDIEETIVNKVREFSSKYDYVFTTGGLGPTHDDITASSMAAAFDCKIVLNAEAEQWIRKQYTTDELNSDRMRMAYMPEKAELIHNPVTLAPGFRIENVYVMAGVPSIARGMFSSFKSHLVGGDKILNCYIHTYLTEGQFASDLAAIQSKHQNTEIGSYPFIHNKKLGTTLVVRSIDYKAIDLTRKDIEDMIKDKGGDIVELNDENLL